MAELKHGTLQDTARLTAEIEAAGEGLAAAREAVGRVIFGQDEVVEQTLITLLAGGHALLIGVPGLGKTRLVETIGTVMGLEDKRVQFTPDLMPADITGTEVIAENKATGEREFKFLQGPIFANLILADEINRTPPKTQAALLEAMQEHQVTVGGRRHPLAQPFFVLATQNPIEQEGTYPLPEAQLDRFMFNVFVDYPEEDEEFQIVRATTAETSETISKVLDAAQVQELQRIVRRVPVADHVIRYAMKIVRMTRVEKPEAPDFVKRYLNWGAGPRASQYLVLAGKTRAVLYGRFFVTTEDIRAVAAPVLRHRIVTNFSAEAEGIRPDDIVRRLIESLPRDESESLDRGQLSEVLGSAHAR